MSDINEHSGLQGKRYITLVRCSTLAQADTSIGDQLKLLQQFADRRGMIRVDDLILEGVSGSLPGGRSDIDQLIARKETRNDFEVLLVQDASRLTRGGTRHGASIEWNLQRAGIEIVFAVGDYPEGAAGELLKTLSYHTAQEHARSIAMTSARGSMSSLESGAAAHCRRPPYGIDRLYTDADGQPKFIIRNLADGTQEKLDPQSGRVLERFGCNNRTGVKSHYIKQKDERVVLVPGAADRVETVQRMYRRHFVDSWGMYRIAKELNDLGIPSATGRLWSTSTVKKILQNTIYLGLGIANRYSSAIYVMRQSGAPLNAKVDPQVLAQNAKPKKQTRPRDQWFERQEDALQDFLEPDIAEQAKTKQDQLLKRQELGLIAKPNRDRHTHSDFFLKGILVSKQGGYKMTGRSVGKKGQRKRYYGVGKGYRCPSTQNKILRRLLSAREVEEVVLRILGQTLRAVPKLRKRIQQLIESENQKAMGSNLQVNKLVDERDDLQRQITFVSRNLSTFGLESAQEELNRLAVMRDRIEAQIAVAGAARPMNTDQVAAETQRIIDLLSDVLGAWERGEMNPVQIRGLVELMVTKAEVDLETRAVEIELSLPKWAIQGVNRLCLDSDFAYKTAHEAQPVIPLMRYKLHWLGKGFIGSGRAA